MESLGLSDTYGALKPSSKLRFVDIGINLTDPVFQGVYHGKSAHQDDLDQVIQRAVQVGCVKFMVTGSSLQESRHAIQLASRYPGLCYATVGVHPCSSQDFEKSPSGAETMLQDIETLALETKQQGHAVAFGEIGLDYDRLFLCPKEPQLLYFERQLEIAARVQMPLFLHSRAASADFERLLRSKMPLLPQRGVVHSFTGSLREMQSILDLNLDIGINGCSMKTGENLAVVKEVPLDRLHVETDGPWVSTKMFDQIAPFGT
ncbi:MAG: hypothetical protein M1833_002810 [Piccolia ochrophora]|nr:MAG: hypothetical protein M1833_002810 [Piccolia ochrophora]